MAAGTPDIGQHRWLSGRSDYGLHPMPSRTRPTRGIIGGAHSPSTHTDPEPERESSAPESVLGRGGRERMLCGIRGRLGHLSGVSMPIDRIAGTSCPLNTRQGDDSGGSSIPRSALALTAAGLPIPSTVGRRSVRTRPRVCGVGVRWRRRSVRQERGRPDPESCQHQAWARRVCPD